MPVSIISPERSAELKEKIRLARESGFIAAAIVRLAKIGSPTFYRAAKGDPIRVDCAERLFDVLSKPAPPPEAKKPPPGRKKFTGGVPTGSHVLTADAIAAEVAALREIRHRAPFNGSITKLAGAIGLSMTGLGAILNGKGTSDHTYGRIRAFISTQPATAAMRPETAGLVQFTHPPTNSDEFILRLTQITATREVTLPAPAAREAVELVERWGMLAIQLVLDEAAGR